MELDQTFIETSGRLTMTTTVDGDPVRMVVPDGMWSFGDLREYCEHISRT